MEKSIQALAPKQVATRSLGARRKLNSAGNSQARPPGQAQSQGRPAIQPPRHETIARMAYFRSLDRGFAPGNELEDWLAAEADFDKSLSAQ